MFRRSFSCRTATLSPSTRHILLVAMPLGTTLFALPSRLFAQLPAPASAPSIVIPPGTRIRDIEFAGVRNVRIADLKAAVAPILVEDQATNENIQRAAEAILAVYAKKGISLAQVISTELTSAGNLRFTVAEGTIRRIIIKGNRKTRERIVREALGLREGDVYHESTARAGRDSLARLGIFDDVAVSPVPAGSVLDTQQEEAAEKAKNPLVPGAPPVELTPVPPVLDSEDLVGKLDIVVSVRERRTGNIAATVGYTDSTGIIGYVDIAEENLFGSADKIRLQWQRVSGVTIDLNGEIINDRNDRTAFGLSYEHPSIGRTGWAYGADIYDTNTVFLPFFTNNADTIRSYERRRGGTVRIGRLVAPALSAFVTARRDDIGYSELPFDVPVSNTLLNDSTGRVGALGLRLQLDRRDYSADPKRGLFSLLSLEHAGSFFGGNLEFNKASLDVRSYIPISAYGTPENRANSSTLALRLLGGLSNRRDGRAVPLPEQFWIGGFELLRGYDLYQYRGERMVLGSAEARFPLNSGLQGVVFVDAGDAWGGTGRSFSPKAGFGAGLRFLTPIGPIRLDAAYGNRFQTYVSLGQAY